MKTIINLLQILLDAGLLFVCCEWMFRENYNRIAKDFLLFPIIIFFCMAGRVSLIVGGKSSHLFLAQGFEIAPADNVYSLLFLILAILLLNSLYFKPKDNHYVLCGSIVVFSCYLLARVISIVIFFSCGTTGNIFLFGSRILSIIFATAFLCSPAFEWLREIIKEGEFGIKLVSVNITLTLVILLSFFSFDIAKFMEHIWTVILLILIMLLVDGILLLYNQHRVQERKRIQMIEQYVPIVEELISQVRARQHEFNNRLLAIETAVAYSESLEQAKQSVALLTDGITLDATDQALLSCDSKIIAGMLYGKRKQADFLHRKVLVELQIQFKKSILPETEWIEILGILLDNAIEASTRGDTIYIKACTHEKFIELTVSNPFPPMSNTEFMKLFGKGVTTKKTDKETHGFGLFNVLTMIEHYRGKIITRNETRNGIHYVVFGAMIPLS